MEKETERCRESQVEEENQEQEDRNRYGEMTETDRRTDKQGE